MPVVVMPDGQQVVMPDNPTPEQLAALENLHPQQGVGDKLAGAAKDLLYSGLAGAGRVFSAPSLAAGKVLEDVHGMGNALRSAVGLPEKPSSLADVVSAPGKAGDAFWQKVGDKSSLTGYAKEGMEGLGAGLASGGGTLASGLAGAAGGLGGEAGEKLTGIPIMRAIGGLFGGGLAGGILGMDKAGTAPQRELARAGRAMSPADYAAAQAKIAQMEQVGAKTGTLAEAFPGDNPLIGLAQEARRSGPENPIAQRLQHREADLQQLGEKAVNQVGPPVSAEDTMFRTGLAADNRIDQMEKYRSGAYKQAMTKSAGLNPADNVRMLFQGRPVQSIDEQISSALADYDAAVAKGAPKAELSRLQNAVLDLREQKPTNYAGSLQPPYHVKLMDDYLSAKIGAAKSQVEKDAYEAVRETLYSPHMLEVPQPDKTQLGTTANGFKVLQKVPQESKQVTPFKVDTSAVATDLKQLQNELISRGTDSGGKKLDRAAVGRAYGELNDFLKRMDPAYAKAEGRYKEISEGLVNPATRGPLGQIAGRNFDPKAPVPPATRLEQIIKDQSAGDIPETMRNIQAGAPEDQTLLRDIARTIVGNKLSGGSRDPGTTLRELPGSEKEAQLRALVQSGGANPQKVLDPLEVADALQRLRGGAPASKTDTSTILGSVARPFTTAARLSNSAGYKTMQEEVGRILASPTPANLAYLKRLAAENPQLKDILTSMGQGAVIGGIAGEPK
jgi:hypothetical protein